jgi:hypothetical protein
MITEVSNVSGKTIEGVEIVADSDRQSVNLRGRLLFQNAGSRRVALTLLFGVVVTVIACACSRSSHVTRMEKKFIFSPDRTYSLVLTDSTVLHRQWLFAQAQRRETTLSIVRGEHPLTERPATGPNPERTFLAAWCPGSDFSFRWVDNSHIDVTVRGCTTAQIIDKKETIDGVAVNYM